MFFFLLGLGWISRDETHSRDCCETNFLKYRQIKGVPLTHNAPPHLSPDFFTISYIKTNMKIESIILLPVTSIRCKYANHLSPCCVLEVNIIQSKRYTYFLVAGPTFGPESAEGRPSSALLVDRFFHPVNPLLVPHMFLHSKSFIKLEIESRKDQRLCSTWGCYVAIFWTTIVHHNFDPIMKSLVFLFFFQNVKMLT